MSRQPDKANGQASDRTALRRRMKQWYHWYNEAQWTRCFEVIDPRLRDSGRVDAENYAEGLEHFKRAYGKIRLWYMRISLHLDEANNKRDDRGFAYVYVVWKDDHDIFHMFRERWVRDSGRWYTRVVGLVPHQETVESSK